MYDNFNGELKKIATIQPSQETFYFSKEKIDDDIVSEMYDILNKK